MDSMTQGRGRRGSFRTKMLGAFALSMIIAAVTTYLIYLALRYYYRSYVYMEDPLAGWRKWMAEIGDLNVFLLLFIPQSIVIFYMITKPYVKNFDRISEGIHHLASGDFTKKVQLSTNDELQQIADDINRAAAKLQEATLRGDVAEHSKDQLVMNLAHDLRTPLTSVIGYLGYMLQHDGSLDPERNRHFTSIAYTKSKRLESLIEQLFEITRMNYGHLTLHLKPLDIGELLTQLLEEMYPLFELNHVQGRIYLSGELGITADGELLARVFENLLSNAARYGSDGLYIDVSAKREQNEIIVHITNYGAMIEEEDMKQLFDLFYSGDRARKQQEGGTGLGLYIAKNIIDQHGGTINVSSEVTATRFTITLPI